MANCIEHKRCPSCAKHGRDRAGDNLGVYDDGSSYCFGCGYRTTPTALYNIPSGHSERAIGLGEISSSNNSVTTERIRQIVLPSDAIGILEHASNVDWLLHYGLTLKEISDNLLLFSEKGVWLEKKKEQVAPLVVFPIYGDGQLLFWTGRNLSYNGTGTKWVIKGKKSSIIHGVYPSYDVSPLARLSCCVCEDIISSIKLGRIIPTYTLFGKSISEPLLKYLSLNYSELLIYLDFDAVDTMMNLKKRYGPYFSKIRIILSPNDPKEYSTEELRQIIK